MPTHAQYSFVCWYIIVNCQYTFHTSHSFQTSWDILCPVTCFSLLKISRTFRCPSSALKANVGAPVPLQAVARALIIQACPWGHGLQSTSIVFGTRKKHELASQITNKPNWSKSLPTQPKVIKRKMPAQRKQRSAVAQDLENQNSFCPPSRHYRPIGKHEVQKKPLMAVSAILMKIH